MKGIVLAGGTGTRLYPLTRTTSKQLLPVYDKPLIYYPISTLMLAGIRDFLIISSPRDIQSYKDLLGDGGNFGVKFSYLVQPKPNGIAEAFILAEDFIGNNSVALILGDNIFHGVGLGAQLRQLEKINGAQIFAHSVRDPENYGVIEFDLDGSVLSIVEKPAFPKSNYVVPGLYFYGSDVTQLAKQLIPSQRGELEITSLNQLYLERGNLSVKLLDRGTAWFDTGTIDSLSDAGNYVRILEERQGSKISCPEEISWRNAWITDKQLLNLAEAYVKTSYGDYLRQLLTNAGAF
jgi:glucose-1-phosphate thymidylyltransferase